jgi:hypothetical protein
MVGSRISSVAVGILVAVGLFGCSPTSPAVSGSPETDLRPSVGAMSPQQTEALARADATGSVSFDDYEAGMRAYSDCVVSSGGTVSNWRVITDFGQPRIDFLVGFDPSTSTLDDTAFEGLLNSCYDFNVGALQVRYASNPGAIELQEQAIKLRDEKYGPVVIDFLQAAGYLIEDDAPKSDWRELALNEAYSGGSLGECLLDTGYIVDGGIY